MRLKVALHQDLPNSNRSAAVAESLLHRLSRSNNRHPTGLHTLREFQALEVASGRSNNFTLGVRELIQAFFYDESNETICIEFEVTSGCFPAKVGVGSISIKSIIFCSTIFNRKIDQEPLNDNSVGLNFFEWKLESYWINCRKLNLNNKILTCRGLSSAIPSAGCSAWLSESSLRNWEGESSWGTWHRYKQVRE